VAGRSRRLLRRDPQFATDTVRIGLFVHSPADSTNDFTVAGVTDTNFVGTLSYDNDGDFTRVLQPCQISTAPGAITRPDKSFSLTRVPSLFSTSRQRARPGLRSCSRLTLGFDL
jgi:hypothetical protein